MQPLESSVLASMRTMGMLIPSPLGRARERLTLLVALSGGPDSVALLMSLHHLSYDIEAAHCNFHLRGEESNRDENFCKQLCEREGIPLHIVHFDTVSYATLHKESIEMAARHLRYHWFAQLCHDINAAGICVAHHMDDQVETVLLNILRGTGINGLTGMKPLSTLNGPTGKVVVLRPMLNVSRAEVLDYLQNLHQDYVVDSTNLEDDVQRNKLRLDIIPMLEKVTPAAKRNIIRMTENLRDIQSIVNASLSKAESTSLSIVEEKPQGCSDSLDSTEVHQPTTLPFAYSLSSILTYPAPSTLLWHILSPYGFNRTQIEEIAQSSKTPNIQHQWASQGFIAIISHGTLYIVDRKQWEQPLPILHIPETGLYRYENFNGKALHIRLARQSVTNSFTIPKEPLRIAIDGSKVPFPLTIRQAQPGDRFTPFGMKGSKLVSDYLKDRKRNIITRHNQLVLTDANGNIVWLIGECIDNHYRLNLSEASSSSPTTPALTFSSDISKEGNAVLLISIASA